MKGLFFKDLSSPLEIYKSVASLISRCAILIYICVWYTLFTPNLCLYIVDQLIKNWTDKNNHISYQKVINHTTLGSFYFILRKLICIFFHYCVVFVPGVASHDYILLDIPLYRVRETPLKIHFKTALKRVLTFDYSEPVFVSQTSILSHTNDSFSIQTKIGISTRNKTIVT